MAKASVHSPGGHPYVFKYVRANHLRHEKAARKAVKALKCLLLRPSRTTNRAEHIGLRELFGANTPLMITYMLREDLKVLCSHQDLDEAKGIREG